MKKRHIVRGILIVLVFIYIGVIVGVAVGKDEVPETSIGQDLVNAFPSHTFETVEESDNETVKPIGAGTGKATEYIFKPYSFIPLSADLQNWIYKLSEKYEVSYNLVLAIIKTESEFDTDCIGDSGQAIGLCQIWPYWWGGVASQYGLDIDNPIDNVELMLIILTSHLKDCGGDLGQALQMYNSGHTHGSDYAERVYNNLDWIESEASE